MTQSGDGLRPIALTMGEPAGIGPEITIRAWSEMRSAGQAIVVMGDANLYRDVADRMDVDIDIHECSNIDEFDGAPAGALSILNIPVYEPVRVGQLSVANAPAVISSITEAVRLAMEERVAGVVTNPINKANLYEARFEHPGHTEFLASLAGIDQEPIMMLAGDELRVVPVTRHVSLRDAVDALSEELILETAETTVMALKRDFGIPQPRIAVTGINPHAGEEGHLGREEIDIIQPAIAAMNKRGIDATGPYAADTLFHAGARPNYDVALCMYHDQALIPIKTIDFSGAVNVTLGLPFVRTSPDHGTALDIAGQGTADCSSLVAALNMAMRMAAHRYSTQRSV